MARRALSTIAILIAALAAAVAGVFLFLQTEAGGHAAARAISALASTPGKSELAIDRLETGLPRRLAASGIAMRDKDGQWLAIDRAEIVWKPLALLRGQLRLDRATARGVRVERIPAGEPAAKDGSGLSLPSLPMAVRLDRFALDDVEIGAAIAGEAVALRASGQLAAEKDGLARTEVLLTRIDGAGGEGRLAVRWNPAAATLDVDARVDEPQGGVVGRALGLPGQPPLTAVLAGQGPLDAWDGRVDVALGKGVGVNARIRSEHAAGAGRAVVHVSGRADVAPLLAPDMRPLTAGGVGFSAALSRLPSGSFRVAGLDVSTAAARVTGAGTVDLGAERFDESFHLDVHAGDAVALAPLIAPFSLAGFSASAGLSGALAQPRIDAVGRIDGISGEGFAVRQADWTAGIVLKAGRIAVTATADLSGLATGGTGIDALIGGAPRLSLEGSLDRALNTFELTGLRLAAPAVAVTGVGTLALADGSFAGKIETTLPELAAFRTLIGPDVAGRIHLSAGIDADEGGPRAAITADAAGLQTGIPAAGVLLGSAPSARARVRLAADGGIRIEDLAVDGTGVRLDASATLRDGAIDAVYRAHVPDMAPAAQASGVALRGAVSVDGTASGPLGDPSVNAAVMLEGGGLMTIPIPSARIDLRAEQLASRPRGTISADVALDEGSIRARVPFAHDGEAMRLGPFSAEGLGMTASGDLAVPLGQGPMRGTLKVRYNGGERPTALAGFTLRGNASADVRLGAAKGEQTLAFTIGGHSLALESADGVRGGADAVALSGTLSGSGIGSAVRLTGDVRLSSERLNYGGTTLAALQGRVSGTSERANFQFTARAPAGLAGEMRTRGTLARRGGKTEVVVRAIDGNPGGHPLALRRPLDVVFGEGEVSASGLDLAVAGGAVTGAFRSGEQGSEGDLRVRRLPLSLIAKARPDLPISGSVDADGSIETQGSHLAGELRLALNQVRMSPRKTARLLDATATLALDAGAVVVDARIVGLGQPLLANVRLPASIDARSFAIQLPPSGPLAGHLTWRGPVGELWELLPMPDQRLTGEANIDVTLGGRVDSPRIEGGVTLDNASYEHFLTGTVIKNLELTAIASGAGGVVVELSGNDGGDGRITGRGTATLAAGLHPTADVAITFEEATLVRRDDVAATLSGTVTFRETAEGAKLAGAIVTNRMEIRLVDRLPPSVVELDVTEINLPPGRTPRSKPGGEQAGTWAAALDIQVDMPRRVFVRGRGLESEWQGNLAVGGTTQEPILTGSVRTLSGVFDFAGKRFTLEKGEIGFTGGKRIDPTIDLEAVRQTEEITAVIAVTGTALGPEIELRSRPSLPESEILARVLFDKDVARLGPIEAAQLGLALDTLASGESMSEDALSYVRNLLGLDVLSVDPGNGDNEGPSLGVGRYVGEGLYVGAKQGTGPESTAGTVELEVLPGLSIESEIGQDEAGATGALGLRWKWDY